MLDGVDNTICSEDAAISLPNGNILFGTLNGYYVVDRSKLVTSNGESLKLRITDFMVNDEVMSPRFNNTYHYYVPDSKKVELPDNSAVFSIRFAALNYQLQHRIHYQYKLEGFEEDWHNADKTRTVSYSDLPAGTYEFKVKAFLLESPDKYDMKTLTIVVPRHFLLSESAMWIYMTLAAAIVITFFYYREEKAKKLKKEEERIMNGHDKTVETVTEEQSQVSDIAEEEIIEEAEIIDDK